MDLEHNTERTQRDWRWSSANTGLLFQVKLHKDCFDSVDRRSGHHSAVGQLFCDHDRQRHAIAVRKSTQTTPRDTV